tara:strand:- start:471 stop:641 length:171 start_codon:yes stop_codon:yes gene_type:complete
MRCGQVVLDDRRNNLHFVSLGQVRRLTGEYRGEQLLAMPTRNALDHYSRSFGNFVF